MNFINRSYKYILSFLLLAGVLFSCEKQEVDFGGSSLSDDPNIANIDTFSVVAYTTQVDSFSTLSTGYFVTGNHFDTTLGNLQALAYFNLSIPYDSTAALKECTSCHFDSLVAVTKFSGGYYGDTTKPFTLNINQLEQRISYEDVTYGYNTTTRPYNTEPLGSFVATVSPSRQSTIRIRLSDAFGLDLYNKILHNSDTVTTSDLFTKYIKGFCFNATSPNNKTVYYMQPVGDSDVVMLYYHKNEPTPTDMVVKFPMDTTHQFNGFVSDHSGTNLTVFTPKKNLEIPSGQTNGYVYLHANIGLYPKFSFPSIYSLKEINTYVSVISATLEIYPLQGSYGLQSIYKLPPELYLYILNDVGESVGSLYYSGTNTLQTGDIYMDYLYNKDTKYTYDVTSYIQTALTNGAYSSYYLQLQPPTSAASSDEQRLILQALNNGSFKLKINVLGF